MSDRRIPRHVAEEVSGDYWVSTVRLTVEHPGNCWYETFVFPFANGEVTEWLEVYGERYPTEDEAAEGHRRVVAALEAGELPL